MSESTSSHTTTQKADRGLLGFLSSICYIWWLETKSTVKDEGVLIFFLLVPLAYPLLYSWIYNNEVVREVPVAVVDSPTPLLPVNSSVISMPRRMYMPPAIATTCRKHRT